MTGVTLEIIYDNVGLRGCAKLALLVKDGIIRELDIKSNNVGDEGARHLKEAMESEKCQLKMLMIGGNKLTDDGVEYFADALSKPVCKLERLNMVGNKITFMGANCLKGALQSEHCKLKHLVLSNKCWIMTR